MRKRKNKKKKVTMKHSNKLILTVTILNIMLSSLLLSNTIPIESYLKSNIMGMPIIYKAGNQVKKAIGIDVIKREGQYNVILNNNDIVRIIFTVSHQQALMRKKTTEMPKALQQQVLNTQQVINNAISRISDSSSLGLGSSSGSSLPNLTPVESNVTTMNINQLHNTEEILYTDPRGEQEKEGFAYATWEGLFLNETPQLPIQLFFRKE